MKTTSEIEELVAAETKRRLEEMESPNYEFVQPFRKSDFILIISIVLINLVLIILAMTGGIQ
ncbi:hypothetical protein SORDD14_00582 [Streptococcus oralis]|uniref:Uncharacterized protein n=1 Tax=Streptococcus oralis TaxID=1303 RepID=A0A139P4Y5_STROR|nr:hypothetical protein [Streptococcus oralis]KXT83212.1 hypothetical protein SORDD14_00582 [Streptococcus oralis]